MKQPYPILKSKRATLAAARRIIARDSIWADDDVENLAHTVVHMLRRKPKRKGKRK